MSRQIIACVVVTCDDCHQPYGCEELGTTWHLTDCEIPEGWHQVGGLDLCEQCWDKRQCEAAGGHSWGSWCELGPIAGALVSIRYCVECTAQDKLTQPLDFDQLLKGQP